MLIKKLFLYLRFPCKWASLIFSSNSTVGLRHERGRTLAWLLPSRRVAGRQLPEDTAPRANSSHAQAEQSWGLTWSSTAASAPTRAARHLHSAANPSRCRSDFPSHNPHYRSCFLILSFKVSASYKEYSQ